MIKWINALIGKGSHPIDEDIPKYFTGKNKQQVVCSKCYRNHWASVFDYKDNEFVCPTCANGKDLNATNL